MRDLHDWFRETQREFPWRVERTPYKVWVSEVMLQQTRASVVVAYFERWLKLFPDVQALADASLEQVIKAWEGLGYYSRARNLHAGARQIVEEFGGQIPSQKEALGSVRGLGPYTVGAILSFGFNQRTPAVDGNVTRVLSRYFLIEEDVSRQGTKRLIEEKAEELLDAKEPWVTAEALIELGATVCLPKPKCPACPLRRGCRAYLEEKAESLPIKKSQERSTELWRAVLLIFVGNEILLKKGEAGKVMADLYEFPYFEMEKEKWPREKILKEIRKNFGLDVKAVRSLPKETHSFTRYKAQLYPMVCNAERKKEIEGLSWIPLKRAKDLPFSSGHRRILGGLE